MVPKSYARLHRYDGAAIERSRRGPLVPCAIQPRDLQLLAAVRSYRFLTTDQLLELFWPHATRPQAGRLRLRKLFDAGHLERFRPVALRGSFPWTFHLGREGHRLLQEAGLAPITERYIQRSIYDYGRVVHDLQLNGWVLAYRRHLGDSLRWEGETDIEPPKEARRLQLRLDDNWSAQGLRDPRPRLLRPDALLQLPRRSGPSLNLLVEHDRTRRVDKNYDKFRRYDAFLCWWWRHHPTWGERGDAPFVLFVCQDEDQRDLFLAAADRELTGHLWHPSVGASQHVYVGRRRVLFACELDIHAGHAEAWRLPALPPRHPGRQGRDADLHPVRLPSAGKPGHEQAA
jgi:hypothetical protein